MHECRYASLYLCLHSRGERLASGSWDLTVTKIITTDSWC